MVIFFRAPKAQDSTINHVGFLLLSLAVFSNFSIESFIFYIVQYTLTNLNIFLIILALSYIINQSIDNSFVSSVRYQRWVGGRKSSAQRTQLTKHIKIDISDIEYINSLKGLFYNNPILSLSLAICLFSFAGIPPLIGFFAKQQVLYSSNSAGYFFLSLTAIIVSVISAFYYLKIIKIVYSPASSPSIELSSTLKVKTSEQQTPAYLNKSAGPSLGLAHSNNNFTYIEDSYSEGSRGVQQSNLGSIAEKVPGKPDNGNLSFTNKSYDNNYLEQGNSINSSNLLKITDALAENTHNLSRRTPHLYNEYDLLSNLHSFIIGVLTLSLMLFILNPELLLNSIAIISSSILNL